MVEDIKQKIEYDETGLPEQAEGTETVKESEEQMENIQYYENKYEIVTRVAFLCGIQDKFFAREEGHFIPEVYEDLKKDQRAMIVRHLCLLRDAIEHNYKAISSAMFREGRAFFGLREYYPEKSLLFLEDKGIRIPVSSRQLTDILGEINRVIADRINNCKSIFPVWLNWEYVKELFVMPNGLKPDGMAKEAERFYSNMSFYPFGTYINWAPRDVGNLFASDYHFIKVIYEQHKDKMFDTSNLSDVSEEVKDQIYDFINDSSKTVLIVDCENADPYSLCAMFQSLDDEQLSKIHKIILYDDPKAPSGWRFFESHIGIDPAQIEHTLIQRILENKSLLDVKLTARVTKEFYKENVESFVLVSSDSDFWGMIEEIPEAKFLVMIEHRKASPELKKVLDDHGIRYCYVDDFYTGMDDSLKKQAIFHELKSFLEGKSFNARKLLNEILVTTRIEMSPAEKQQFYDKHLKSMQLRILKDGKATIEFKK